MECVNRGVRIVYIYQKYEEEKYVERKERGDQRWIFAGGLLIALSLMFNIIDINTSIHCMSVNMGFTGWGLNKMLSAMGEFNNVSIIFYIPILTPVIGAVLAALSYLNMKGNDILTDRHMRWMGIACIVLPLIFFMFIYNAIGSDEWLTLIMKDASVRPGPAMVMQIAGGIMVCRSTKRNCS